MNKESRVKQQAWHSKRCVEHHSRSGNYVVQMLGVLTMCDRSLLSRSPSNCKETDLCAWDPILQAASPGALTAADLLPSALNQLCACPLTFQAAAPGALTAADLESRIQQERAETGSQLDSLRSQVRVKVPGLKSVYVSSDLISTDMVFQNHR